MVLHDKGVIFKDSQGNPRPVQVGECPEQLRSNTMAYQLLEKHNVSSNNNSESFSVFGDALASSENVYVNVLQTAVACGFSHCTVPTFLFNDHNSLCAVGGTICEDDHQFGLSCAKKYGGIYVQPFAAVIHQFMREQFVSTGKLIISTDSHTRYGALGALGFGEGGGEMVRQLLGQPYLIHKPKVVAVRLSGRLHHGVGPHDVALSIIREVYRQSFVKNCIMEFIGKGISALSMDERINIDAMTTEMGALSSIWETDEKTEEYYTIHGRRQSFSHIRPQYPVYYDRCIELNLSEVQPMIALPFHPSNVWTIHEFNQQHKALLAGVEAQMREEVPAFSLRDMIHENGVIFRQSVVAGCVGGLYENICAVANILEGTRLHGFSQQMHVYPASTAVMRGMTDNGVLQRLHKQGVVVFPSYCGPCFGTQDTPCNNEMVIRHVTRNFMFREGSRPAAGQGSCVALMDARSIAATMRNGGVLTGADQIPYNEEIPAYSFDTKTYEGLVYNGFGRKEENVKVVMGPNIRQWPDFKTLPANLLLEVAGVYGGTLTSDDLLPSGEASAYRSNPEKLAEYTLSNFDAGYYPRAVAIRNNKSTLKKYQDIFSYMSAHYGITEDKIGIGSIIVGDHIGEGSAREQAASNQRVLGGWANLANEYCTKRYRGNLINWGLLPLQKDRMSKYDVGDILLLVDIRQRLEAGEMQVNMVHFGVNGAVTEETAFWDKLTQQETELLLKGGLINLSRPCNAK